MKRFSLASFAVATITFYFLYAQDGAPRIVFDSQAKDFGIVIEGEHLKHVFRFTNTGNALLEIFKVEPS